MLLDIGRERVVSCDVSNYWQVGGQPPLPPGPFWGAGQATVTCRGGPRSPGSIPGRIMMSELRARVGSCAARCARLLSPRRHHL